MSRFFPGWSLRHHLAAVTAFAIAFVLGSLVASAASPQFGSQDAAQGIDVFAAVEAGDLEVSVVPQNERRVTIQLKNISNRPLTIQLPPAFAAVPILAQQPGLFPGFPNPGGQNQNQQQAPQQLGLGMNGGNRGGNNNGGGNLFGGMFDIPAGRAIKIKADAVCLEYGKPSPDARMKYELKPLAEVCDKPELAAVLTSLGKDQIDQRTAQAAAWHLTDDLSFNKLAGLLRREVGATKEYQFTQDQVAAAQKYLAKLPSKKQPANSSQKVASSP
jgi:hypothetical protein